MAHHIYHTDALVLSSINTGEAHRFVDLLTREIGLVRAKIQSARLERSKLRYSTQPFSYLYVSLVRGRDLWRVTGADPHHNIFYELAHDIDSQLLIGRVISLIKRLVQGEEQNEYLFEIVHAVYDALARQNLTAEEKKGLECVAVLRIMYSLGYLGEEPAFAFLFENTGFDAATLAQGMLLRKEVVTAINRSLEESHL